MRDTDSNVVHHVKGALVAQIGRFRLRWIALVLFSLVVGSGAVRAGQDTEAYVRGELERYVRAHAGKGPVSVDIPRLSVFAVDRSRFPGPLRIEFSTRSRSPFRGRVPITVALHAGSSLVKRSVISPYVRVTNRVVVPARDLRRGDVLSAGDLAYAELDDARVAKDVVREIEVAVGLRMKRSLRKDQALRSSQLERVPVVERGDRVMLVLESGLLQIQATGKAEESGAAGEWIRVRNLQSRREISGRVDREGRVHVAF